MKIKTFPPRIYSQLGYGKEEEEEEDGSETSHHHAPAGHEGKGEWFFPLPLAHPGRQAQPSTKEEKEEIRFLLFPLIRATQPPVLTYLLLPPPPSPAQARGENPANTR